MVTDKIATAANKLRRDIESRYLCKCSFDGSCVSSGVQLTCCFDDWNFTYKFDMRDLIANYNSVLGNVIIELDNEWTNRMYRE